MLKVFMYSILNKYYPSSYCGPANGLDTEDTMVNETYKW